MNLRTLALLSAAVVAFGPAGLDAATKPDADADFQLPSMGTPFVVKDFVPVGGEIFFQELHRGNQGRQSHRFCLGVLDPNELGNGVTPISVAELDIVPSSAPRILFQEKGMLRWFDSNSFELVTFNPLTRKVTDRVKTNVLEDLRPVAGGKYIAVLDYGGAPVLRDPRSMEIENLSEMAEETAREFGRKSFEEGEALKRFNVFLLDQELRIEKPLMLAYPYDSPDSTHERSRLEMAMSQRSVRVSPNGQVAAVFSIYFPEITLFDRYGNETGRVVSPGSGMEVPDPAPSIIPSGTVIMHHLDVLPIADKLIVAHGTTPALSVVSAESGEVLSDHEIPFVAVELEANGNHLYARSREGRLLKLPLNRLIR